MSELRHRQLQRALVVLQHALDPAAALAALPLGDRERATLAAVDPRALAADPGRRQRLLTTLAEEYKASTTLVLAEHGRLGAVLEFFADARFARTVMADGILALAFGDFLATRLSDALASDVLRLERARAACRREVSGAAGHGIGLAPGVACVRVDGHALDLMNAVERWLHDLARLPQLVLAADRPALPRLGADNREQAYALGPAGNDIAFAPIDGELARILEALCPTRPAAEARATLIASGVPAPQLDGLLDALVDDGLVTIVT
jgi:hypothetical protein